MSYQEPTTVAELRAQLIHKDIPSPTAAQLNAATAAHGRGRIVAALRTLYTEPKRAEGARAFLKNCFGREGAVPSPQDPPVQAQRPAAASAASADPEAPSATPEAPSAAPAPRRGDDDARRSHHVYGGRAALCFESSRTRREVPTVTLDAAPSTGPKAYDWKSKTSVQFTVDELPVVLAVFLGIRPACEFKSHGPNKDKGFAFEVQDEGKVFAKVFSPDGVRAVPITRPDVFHVARLLLAQLKASAQDGLDGIDLITLLKATMAR